MSLPLLLQGLGSIGVFSSRAFLPAFATALLLRFGPEFSWLAQTGLIRQVLDVPTWFTSDLSLMILGVLSVLELAAERNPEIRAALDEIHDYLKTGMAALTYLGILSASDRAAVAPVVDEAGFADLFPVLAVAAGTFFTAKARGLVVGTLSEADGDDSLGLLRLARWVEDLWGAFGPLALVLLPLLTLGAFAIALGLLVLLGRSVEAREKAALVPCERCNTPISVCASACPKCQAPVKDPKEVGLLGVPSSRPADSTTHPYRLVAVKRCPVCASRLGRRSVAQSCEACGRPILTDPEFVRAYLAFVDRKVPLVLLACALLGMVPILGVIPAVILYRLTIVAPFRRYIPPGRNFLLRWGIRLVSFVLVAFQWVPLLGGLLLPVLALVNYGAYRRAFVSLTTVP